MFNRALRDICPIVLVFIWGCWIVFLAFGGADPVPKTTDVGGGCQRIEYMHGRKLHHFIKCDNGTVIDKSE